MKTSLPHYPSKLLTLSRKYWLLFLLLVTVLLPHKLLAQISGIYQADIILNSKNTRNIAYRLDADPNVGTFYGVTIGSFSTDEKFYLRGAEIRTYKNGGCDVKNARLEYVVYPVANRATQGICNISLPFGQDVGYSSTGSLNQIWREDRGQVNLLDGLIPGSYVLEVYIESDYGNEPNKVGCGAGTNYFSNDGQNFIAYFNVTQGVAVPTPYLGCPTRPLPVALTSFEAKRQENNAQLIWETASEVNSHGYEVQVSTDSRTFRAINYVPSQSEGSSIGRRRYTYTDTEAGKTGVRYYRLRQVDIDGKETFYGPRIVSFNKTEVMSALVAAPNPFSSEVTLTLPAQEGTRSGTVVVTDMVGRTVFNQPLLLDAGTSQVQLPELSSLPKGLYHLRLSLNGEQQAVKLLKE
jgi:hypothetical protein